MKEHGILFSAPMVRALLAGRKTQTRRGLNPQPPEWVVPRVGTYCPNVVRHGMDTPGPVTFGAHDIDGEWTLRCPHPVGTRLYVRETSAVGDDGRTHYRADGRPPMGSLNVQKWTPSLLMPRSRARIFPDVTGVRVERAQDISDADVAAEGVDAEAVRALWAVATRNLRSELMRAGDAHDINEPFVDGVRPIVLWRLAWTLINGRASWDANPWVWVYEFKRTEALR